MTADRPATGPEPLCPHGVPDDDPCEPCEDHARRFGATGEDAAPRHSCRQGIEPCAACEAADRIGEDAVPRTEAPLEGPHLHSTVGELIACHTRTHERAAQGAAAPPERCGCACHGVTTWVVCPHCTPDLFDEAAQGAADPPDLREAIVEVLHRYECDDEPPGHEWREHLPEDEPEYHPNRIDGLVALFRAAQGAAAPPDPRGNAAIEAIGRIQRSIHMEGRVASDGTLVTTEAIVKEAREAIRDFHDGAARLSGASTDSTDQ